MTAISHQVSTYRTYVMMPIALEENGRVEIERKDITDYHNRMNKIRNIKCSYHMSAAVVTGSSFRTSGAVGIVKMNK